jgi:ribose 5-phosphate isomerase A
LNESVDFEAGVEFSSEEKEIGKRAAAHSALDLVTDGMLIGIGTGSTAAYFIQGLGERVLAEHLHITGVPTSKHTAVMAAQAGIPLTSLEAAPLLDLDVDGADEIDGDLNVLKGGGGALLHEKIVALSSRRFVVIADRSKLVTALSVAESLPVEVVAFGWTATQAHIRGLGGLSSIRGGEGSPYVTDSGNLILDVVPPPQVDIFEFVNQLKIVTGVIDHGIFQHIATRAIIGYGDGSVRSLPAQRDDSTVAREH